MSPQDRDQSKRDPPKSKECKQLIYETSNHSLCQVDNKLTFESSILRSENIYL